MSQTIILKFHEDRHIPTLYKFKRGSYGPNSKFIFNLQNKDGTARDLTGFTLNFKLYEIWRKIPLHKYDLTITDETRGIVEYVPESGDFNVIKEYYFRVELEDAHNRELTEEAVLIIL